MHDEGRNRLVLSYRNFILSTARKFKKIFQSNLETGDLYQEGVLALLEAVNEYDLEGKFSQYARDQIRKSLLTYIEKEGGREKLFSGLRIDFASYRLTRAKLFEKLQCSPTLKELASATHLPLFKIRQLEIMYQTALNYDEEGP